MISLDVYRDKYGVIRQHSDQGFDDGDSAHRHGVEYLFKGYPSLHYEFFLHSSGQIIRNPSSGTWTNETERSTRDQNTPWICAYAINACKKQLKLMYKGILSNFSRFHNYYKNGHERTKKPHNKWYEIDIAGPEIHACFIRGLKLRFLYPLLWILDLETLIGTLIWNKFRDSSDNDITNHICILKLSNEIKPTFVSTYALKFLDKDLAIKKLREYWDHPLYSKEPNKDPAILGEIIIKWLKKVS